MKKTALIMVAIISVMDVCGQGSVVSKYFDQYSSDTGFVKVSISSKMFSLFTEMEGSSEEEKEFLDAISKIKGMKAVINENMTSSESERLYKNASADIADRGYEELVTIVDAEENVKIAIREERGIIKELILAAGGNKKFVLVSMYGEIDLKKISKLASIMRIQGMHHLKNLDDKD